MHRFGRDQSRFPIGFKFPVSWVSLIQPVAKIFAQMTSSLDLLEKLLQRLGKL
jgi:hypothetical protein